MSYKYIHIFLTGFNLTFLRVKVVIVFLWNIDFLLKWTTGLRESLSIVGRGQCSHQEPELVGRRQYSEETPWSIATVSVVSVLLQ